MEIGEMFTAVLSLVLDIHQAITSKQLGNYILMSISAVQLCCVLLLLLSNNKEVL